jgi:hypothetical protein
VFIRTEEEEGMKKKIIFVCAYVLMVSLSQAGSNKQYDELRERYKKVSACSKFALIELENEEISNPDKILRLFDNDIWAVQYLKDYGIVFLAQKKMQDKKKNDAKQIKDLLKQLERSFPEAKQRIIWAMVLKNAGDCYAFPTGVIRVFFDKNTTLSERKKALSKYKDADIVYLEDFKYDYSPREPYAEQDVPGYVAWARERGKSLPFQDEDNKEYTAPLPIAVITFPDVQRNEMYKICIELMKKKIVDFAIPDARVLGKNLITLHNMIRPPHLMYILRYDDDITGRNLVHRAWELFYPQSGCEIEGFEDKFTCSDDKVAVFDADFYDHTHLRRLWIGWDAWDNDHDPRSPVETPADQIHLYYCWKSPISYLHGTVVCGVISGIWSSMNTGSGSWMGTGMAQGTFTIPFRPSHIDNIDLETCEGLNDFICEYSHSWYNAMLRLYRISNYEGVAIANASIEICNISLELTGMDVCINWFIRCGYHEKGIFFTCSAGNNPEHDYVANPAEMEETYAVGSADFRNGELHGNYGEDLDITVDRGGWAHYCYNNIAIARPEDEASTSITAPVVAGVAALMRMACPYHLGGAEIKEILQYSTRQTEVHAVECDQSGHHDKYGYGFIDAFHAAKIAYKDFREPVQARKIRFAQGVPSGLLLQASFPSNSSCEGMPSGIFWYLVFKEDKMGYYWRHWRFNPGYRSCEVNLDPISPMGELLAVDDFDGDGLDEIALQLGYWLDSPEHHFIIKKFNANDSTWNGLGQRYDDIPSVQLSLPENLPVAQVLTAKLINNKALLLIRQGNILRMAGYNEPDDKWQFVGPESYLLKAASASLLEQLGLSSSMIMHKGQVIDVKHVMYQQQNVLAVVGRIRTFSMPTTYITVSALHYNVSADSFEYEPLDNNGETHIVVFQSDAPEINQVLTADIDGDHNEELMISISDQRNFLVTFDVERQVIRDEVIVSSTIAHQVFERRRVFHPGDVNGDGKSDLVYLHQGLEDKVARFLIWRPYLEQWDDRFGILEDGRKENRVVDLLVGDYNNDGVSEIGLLMEKPHRNIYRVFHMKYGIFQEIGFW